MIFGNPSNVNKLSNTFRLHAIRTNIQRDFTSNGVQTRSCEVGLRLLDELRRPLERQQTNDFIRSVAVTSCAAPGGKSQNLLRVSGLSVQLRVETVLLGNTAATNRVSACKQNMNTVVRSKGECRSYSGVRVQDRL